MSGELPSALRAAIEALAGRHPGGALAAASDRLTRDYRSGRGTRLAAPVDLAAYAVARMPATYAACAAAMNDVAARVDFEPTSLLDIGCGPGTAAWAAAEAFPSLTTALMVDAHPGMIALGQELALQAPSPLAEASWRQSAMDRALDPADLVVSAYALNEIPLAAVASQAARLFAAAKGLVVLVEPGTPQGFAVIDRARAALVAAGGRVVAPCPHDGPCPVRTPDWCHFSTRLPRLRAHKAAKGADVPFEDERYAFVAVAKPGLTIRPAAARILRPPKVSKPATEFHLCTPPGLVVETVPTRDKPRAKLTRKCGWGDEFPIGAEGLHTTPAPPRD